MPRPTFRAVALAAWSAASIACGRAPAARATPARMVQYRELEAAPAAKAEHRIAYGEDASLRYGELPRPPADAGDGWPGTCEDVARGTDHVAALARRFPPDPARVVVVGHSAGGHLALWLAARSAVPLPGGAPPLRPRGVVGLAPITDLRAYGAAPGGCNGKDARLLGGTAAEQPARYAAASPVELLPLGVPVRLVHGALDPIVPAAQSRVLAERARAAGDDASGEVVEGAGHVDVVASFAPAGGAVERAVLALARGGAR